jgi:outer membrane protein OmpU
VLEVPFKVNKGKTMKKVLFATTALVATAGVASADIALSGSAQMGIQGGSANDTTQFVQDIDITFTMSGTADNGTTFGAAIDLDENAAGVGTNDAGVAIFISGDLGTLTLGDTDGALDWAMQEVDFNGARRSTTTTPRMPASTATAASTVTTTVRSCATTTASATSRSRLGRAGRQHDRTAWAIAFNSVGLVQVATRCDGDPIWGIGAKYSGMFAGGTFGVGIGYQFTNDGDNIAGTRACP